MTTESLQVKKRANTEYPILESMQERWSPRQFSDKKVSEKTLMQLFDAARWAASSYNAQPWRFIYAFKGDAAYQKIYDHLSEFNQGWANNAPVLILTAYKKHFDNGKENFHALHDLGAAAAHFALEATKHGIAIHQMAGVKHSDAGKAFGIGEEYHVATAISVGYYGGDVSELGDDLQEQETAKRSRKDISEFAFKGEWKAVDSE